MAVLRIFGDEAGTMPNNDDDAPFTAATIATLDEIPRIEQPSGHVQWLIEQLNILNAIPGVAFVIPKPGFGDMLKQKLEKMNTMARATRLMTGANSKYLTRDGLRFRNYVWLYVMQQSVVRTVFSAILRTEITAIEITLDQKTMAIPTRNVLERQSLRICDHIMESLRGVRQIDCTKVALYESRVQFSPNSITLRWSDQACASDAEGGLRLAHYLATHYRRGLMRNGESGIETLLRENGFTRVEIDITDLLLAPFDKEIIQEWETSTGLTEPKL